MKLVTSILILVLSQITYANVPTPKLCNSDDYKAMKEIFEEMDSTGYSGALYSKHIGIRGGDCTDSYSLEKSAGRPHKMDSPAPACGIIFILDEASQADQASWILDTIGSVKLTANGRSMRVCSEVSKFGPQ